MAVNKTKSWIRLLKIVLTVSPLFCLWVQAAGAAPSLSIANTLSTTGYQTGSPGVSSNFKIVITNTGDSALNSLILTDLMPNGIVYTGATPASSSNTLNENCSTTITWNIGTMNPGDSKTIYPRCTRNGKVFGLVVNNAVVTGKDQAGKSILASKACSVTVLKPDVRIVEAASPSSGASCTDVTFVINIFNTGNDTFNSVCISDLLPKGMYYNSEGTTPQPNSVNNYDNGTTNLTWNNLGYFGIGGSKTITVKARINGEVNGEILDRLNVLAKPPRDFAYYIANTTSTKIQAFKSGVELSEAVFPTSGSPGTIADLVINISNTGEVPLRLELTDTIPEGLTFVSSNPAGSEIGRTIKWNNLGNLSPGNSIPVRLTAKIDSQKYGTLVNRATVTGWPPEGCNVTDEDSLELTSYRSGLQVSETPTPESGAPGSSIDFKIDITNTGEVNLDAINVEDLLPAGLRYSSASVDPTEKKVDENGTTSVVWNDILAEPLAPNATTSIHLVAVLDGSHSGSLQNKISTRGLTPAGFNVTTEDSKSVTAFMSAIHVAETATPDSGCLGTLVDFRIDLTNAGELNLESLRLVDLLPKGLRFRSTSIDPAEIKINDNGTTTISWNNIQIVPLTPGTSTSIHLLAEIDGAQFGTIQNSVVAEGTPPNGFNVTADDNKNINAYRSALAVVESSAPASGSPGTLVDFKIDLTNTGEVELNGVNLVDILPKGLRYTSASVSPTDNRIGGNGTTSIVWENVLTAPLAPYGSTSIHLIAAVDGTQSGPLQNKIRAVGTPPTGYNVTVEDEKNITAYRSAVQVSLTSSPESGSSGTLVDLRIDVINAGEVSLGVVKLLYLLPKGLSYSSASVNPTEKIVDTAGDTSLTWNNILTAPLAPNSSATIHLAAIIDGAQFGPLQNTITVVGMPQTGSNVTTEIKQDIIVRKSAIEVADVPTPEKGTPGTSVDFEIEIANKGDVNLNVVKVVDLLPKGLKYSSSSIDPDKKTVHHNKSTSVTWNNILAAPLVPNGVATIHLTSKIDESQPGSLQNIVTATGMPPTGYNVTAEDEKNITVCRSAIEVSETPTPESGCPGTMVDFKIDITNKGDVNLDAVKVVDLLPKGLKYSSSSIDPDKKTVHHDKSTSVTWNNILAEPLAPNASASFHLVSEIDGTQQGSLQNTVTATGMPPAGYSVIAEDEKNITVCRSAIDVSETAIPESGCPGTLVDFEMEITNTGDVNLDAVKVVDLLPKGLKYSSSSINPNKKTVHRNKSTSVTWNNILVEPLVPGASTSFHLVSKIDGTQPGSLQNTVAVTGTIPSGYNVTADDNESISACESAIQVAAVPNPESGNLNTLIDFKIDITNTGDSNLDAIKLVDLLPKGLKYSSASIDPTKKRVNHNKTTLVTWNEILTEPLAPNASKSIHLAATIDGTQSGLLQSKITASGRTSEGFNVTGDVRRNVTACLPAIGVAMTLAPESGSPGTLIDFKIEVTNTGEVNLDSVKLVDMLPKGLRFLSASVAPSLKKVDPDGTTNITWKNVLDLPLAPNSSTSIHLGVRVDGTQYGALQNRVVALGIPRAGFIVTGEDLKNVTAYRSAIQVAETPTPSSGSLETPVDFRIELTNTGEVNLNDLRVIDLLPKGLNYSSASIDPDSNRINTNGSRTIIWNSISNSALSPGSSTFIHLNAKIDGLVFGGLKNEITAIGKPYSGDRIYGSGSVTVKALQPILVSINSSPDSGPKGSNITFGISLANPSNVSIRLNSIVDSLPAGLNYVSSDPASSEVGNTVTWSNPGDLAPGDKTQVKLVARIDGSKFGELTNSVTVSGISSTGYKVVSFGYLKVNALAPILTISKTASKKAVSPGEEITYTILITNTGRIPVKNVLVRDNFDSRIEFVSASPMPDSNGVWHFSLIEPRSSKIITLMVRVPVESEINFKTDQKITGEGFVNVANKFSSTQELYYLINQVSVTAVDFRGYANEKVTISSGPGTELQANEHGSGSYSSEAILQLHSKDRSVEVEKILSAKTKPTTFALPGNRIEHFRSKWSDRTSAKNRISGTSTEESYRYANKIDHSSKTKLDRNGTDISIRADFEGDAHLGFLRKSGTADTEHHTTENPTFESREHYAGSFRISEDLNEYGEDVRMNESANGTGTVNADKHIRQSQRTYESGSGDYRIEERIDTPTSYMAKKINLTRHPVRYGYLSGMNFAPASGWKEGMWSKMKDTGYITESFEDIERLKKETTAKGLNQMETEANFSGRARFGACSGDNMKLDQENNGDFSIRRNLQLKGVANFDRPHVLVIKEGHTRQEKIDGVNVTVADYKIKVQNDGNTSLEPVLIRDLFPSGTKFLNSSIKPIKTDSVHANWTLMNLGIGSSITIDLWLKAEPDSDLVNRVEVTGGYGDKWVTASNISAIEKSWLGCCPPEIYLTETARIDPLKKNVVQYDITLKNSANSTMTALVTDHIPRGMRFLNSSMEPSNQSQNEVKWMVMDLAPGEERFINYKAEASRDGKFTDLVHVDACLEHGLGSVSADTSADVVIGPTPGKTGISGMDSSCTGINCTSEPASDYNWNQEPPAECSGPCPAFSESSDEEIS